MPEANVLDTISIRLSNLKSLQGRLEGFLSKQGSYNLSIVSMRNKIRYYAVSRKENKRVYLGQNKLKTLARLSVKLYKENLLQAAKDEIKVLEHITKLYGKTEGKRIEDVYPALPSDLKEYVTPDSSTDEGFAKLWSEQSFIQAKRTEFHKFKYNDRTVVRSKSEYMLAQIFDSKGIPFRYEQRLVVDPNFGMIYYPDFTILNKRTRQVIYWEHMGKLGDESYCSDNIQKLEDYADYGIIQGKNLILTYECAGKPLSTKMVELLIKEFLE